MFLFCFYILEFASDEVMMKRVLFLLGAYYPLPKANGVCAERVISQMRARGYHVDVIAFGPEWPCVSSGEWNGVSITYIRGSMYYRTLRSEECGTLRGVRLKLKKFIGRLKDIILFPFWPSNTPFCTKQFYDRAEELHSINPYDAIIGVVSPTSALSAATLFKKKHPEVKMVAYFLDAVSCGVTPRFLPRVIGVWMGQRWEKHIFRCADSIIMMESHKNRSLPLNHRSQFKSKEIYLDIPLFCPNCIPTTTRVKSDKGLHVVFVGSINISIRNPLYVLKLASLMPDSIVFDFYGTIDNIDAILPYFNQSNIHFHGVTSHENAQRIQENADFLLNIGNNLPNIVPSKIFEYMSTGKPIISTRPIEDEPSLPYLTRYGGCLILDEREEDLSVSIDALNHFLLEYNGWRADMNVLKKEFLENTPSAFVDNMDILFLERGES